MPRQLSLLTPTGWYWQNSTRGDSVQLSCLVICMLPILKSEVAIAFLFRQTKRPKKILLQVKTITTSPGNGFAESIKSCNLHQTGSFKA